MMYRSSRVLLMNASSSQLPRDQFGRIPNNFYQLLKVSNKSSLKEIKQAFVVLAKQYHPDNRNGGDQELFRQLNEAYKVLSDPARRVEYDFEMYQEEQAKHFEKQFKQQQRDEHDEINKTGRTSHHHRKQRGVRSVNLSEEDQQRFMEMMMKRKREGFVNDSSRNNHEHMFVDLKKQKKNPWKLVALLVGGVTLLWTVKLTMWYNSVYKNWKGTDEVIDVVHPLANDAEGNVQRSAYIPHNIKNMLIQYQDRNYIDAKYYKQTNSAGVTTTPTTPTDNNTSTNSNK